MNQIKETEIASKHHDPAYEDFIFAVGGPDIYIPPKHVPNWCIRIWVDQLSRAANINPEYIGELYGLIGCLDQETGFSPEQIFTYKNGQDPRSDHIKASHLYQSERLSPEEVADFGQQVGSYFDQTFLTPYLSRLVNQEKVNARHLAGLIEHYLYPRISHFLTR